MLVLMTYDINTSDSAGKRRLRQISKLCVKYGQRVQNSVFELDIDGTQLAEVRVAIGRIMNTDIDSVRIYRLGGGHKPPVEHFGAKAAYQADDLFMF